MLPLVPPDLAPADDLRAPAAFPPVLEDEDFEDRAVDGVALDGRVPSPEPGARFVGPAFPPVALPPARDRVAGGAGSTCLALSRKCC